MGRTEIQLAEHEEWVQARIHASEVRLLNFIRSHLQYGELTIVVRDGLPTHGREALKSVIFDKR